MKKFLLPLLAFVLILSACSSTTVKDKDDPDAKEEPKKPAADDEDETEADVQSDPEMVMKAIFKAAKSGDYAGLSKFCDPDGEGDEDVKMICDIENESSKKQEEFQTYFSKGKVVGEAEIEGADAKVEIRFGPDGDRKETMNMVKKNKKWYLSSF